MRHDNRSSDQLRPLEVRRGFTSAPGSIYIRAGRTTLLCTASIDNDVPAWKKRPDVEPTGWLTAEYNMLPGSTVPRKRRDRTRVDGRTTEIQRLIGRSLRAAVDFAVLGPRTVTIDCDVLEADGGTRTLGITGGFLALLDAIKTTELDPACIVRSIAAVSVGIVEGEPVCDLDYIEDRDADVDLNVVGTGDDKLIEVQGTAEGEPFDRSMFDRLLDLATTGIEALTVFQRETMGTDFPIFSAADG